MANTTEDIGKDRYGRFIGPGFGSLSYTIPAHAGVKSKLRVYRFWPEILEQTHGINGSKSQSHTWQHFYSKNYAAGQLQITGRVRYQEQYDQLAQFIRDHQFLLVTQIGASNDDNGDQLSLMTLSVPSENLSWAGWIPRFQGGAKRFNVAPEVTFGFEVITDRHSTNEYIVPSAALKSVFTGQFLSGPVSQQAAQKAEEAANAVTEQNLFAQMIGNKLAAQGDN
jgi:hypothetical protein